MNTIKLLSITTALTFAFPAFAEEQTVDITADNFTYSDTNVVAQGNVRVISDKGSVFAKEITYNSETGAMVATGDVVYVNASNITVFSEELTLEDELSLAIAKDFALRFGTPEKWGPTLSASSMTAEKNQQTLTLRDVNFTACECDKDAGEEPLWNIEADDVDYNDATGQVTYKHAKLNVKGVPVFYFPYFRHGVKDVAMSGLLSPSFGTSTNRGQEYEQGYHFNIAQNQDATMYVKAMSNKGTMLRGEHRYRSEHLFTNVKGSIINDVELNRERAHANVNAEYVADKGLRAGLVGTTTSDDLYLDEFFDAKKAYHKTSAYIENASEDHYYGMNASYFQDITEGHDNAETAQLLPRITLERTFAIGSDSRNITLGLDTASVYRQNGDKNQRLTTSMTYKGQHITPDGSMLTLETALRSDVYNVDTDTHSPSSSEEGGSVRFLPHLAVSWEKPLINTAGTHKITPKVMFIAAPNKSSHGIPNEDSVAYELDYSNLFSTNRFSGYDRQEDGSRVVYGVDNHWGDASTAQWRFFIGQSYRLREESEVANGSGTETQASDWVGYVSGQPREWAKFSSYFRIDNSEFSANRMDNEVELFQGKDFIKFTHTLLDNGPEEFTLRGRYQLVDDVAFEGAYKKDLTNDRNTLLAEGALLYNADCAEFSFTVRRSGYENRTIPPSTSYMFNVNLLTLGAQN